MNTSNSIRYIACTAGSTYTLTRDYVSKTIFVVAGLTIGQKVYIVAPTVASDNDNYSEFNFYYKGSGNDTDATTQVDIFGVVVIPSTLINKTLEIKAIYEGTTSTWDIVFKPNITETDIITGAQICDDSIDTAHIINNKVTFAKVQQLGANTVAVNATTGTANMSTVALTPETVLGRLAAGNIVPISKIDLMNMLMSGAWTLSAGKVLVGSVGNVGVAVDLTGAITVNNAGLTTLGTVVKPSNLLADNITLAGAILSRGAMYAVTVGADGFKRLMTGNVETILTNVDDLVVGIILNLGVCSTNTCTLDLGIGTISGILKTFPLTSGVGVAATYTSTLHGLYTAGTFGTETLTLPKAGRIQLQSSAAITGDATLSASLTILYIAQ